MALNIDIQGILAEAIIEANLTEAEERIMLAGVIATLQVCEKDVPPIFTICQMAGRPLSSVFKKGDNLWDNSQE